jgi:signal transduction histidine kinase
LIRALTTLRRRVGFATAALVLIVGLALILTSIYSVARIRATRVSDFVRLVARDPRALDCAVDPARFGLRPSDGSTVFAYDRRTGRSANPAAPPVDQELLEDIRRGEVYSIRTNALAGRGVVMVAVEQPAPCDVFQLHWMTASGLRLRTTLSFALILALGIAFAVTAGGLWVVRPLLKRLSHAATLASRVGIAGESIDPADPSGSVQDELTDVDRALRDAHRRILEDRAQIESKNRALAEHIADVAHDLKTPLSSLQLELEALGARLGDGDAELGAIAARALTDVVYLDALVANLRVASELEDAEPRRAAVDLGSLLDRCVSRVAPLARRKGIELAGSRPDDPVTIQGDMLHLERTLMNLLQNAVAHHDVPDGVGHVAAVLARDGDSSGWTLSIIDDGPGVPPTELPTIAERRKKGREGDGQGLGLAIVAAVCAREGIALSWDREEPRGLRVTLRG